MALWHDLEIWHGAGRLRSHFRNEHGREARPRPTMLLPRARQR